MDEVNGEFAPISELDCTFENINNEMVQSDSVQMNAKESKNEENTNVEMKNEQDTKSEAKDDEKLEVGSRKKVSKSRKKLKNKKMLSRQKIKGAFISMTKLDKDEHQKESIMVSGDDKKKECGISEASNQESTKEEVKNEEKPITKTKNEELLEARIKKKVNRLRERGKKKSAALRGTNDVAAKYTDNPETSKKKSKTTGKGTGMIFMCSSKTKKDCFHYQVLGLPASKRDMVLKICAGMKLFLFDIDSKLMYGVYKAAGPGGYNIEPKAFKSAFPSQVRFTVQDDCAPLAEKEFKKIIIDNYYSKNKFHSELTLKQVKDLCKLFRASIKSSKSTQLLRTQGTEASRYVGHESKPLRRSWKAETHTFMDPKPKRLRRSPRAETQTSLYRDSARHHSWDEERRPAPPRDYLYPEEPLIYRREVYASPEAYAPLRRPIPLPSAVPLLRSLDTGIYQRNRLDTDIYGRDRHLYHDPQQPRPQTEFARHDPYFSSREHLSYRDSLFPSSQPPEYHPRRPSGEYHSSPGLRPEYQPPRPLYQYYS